MPHAQDTSPAVFTAGFSNLCPERFINNLRMYDIQVLVDVRSHPFASHAPHFNKNEIEVLTERAGMCYLYLGRELGGIPDDPELYDQQGYVLYDRIAAQPWFEQGIRQVMSDLRLGKRLALTCAEDDPRHCHRRLLVGRVLRERGIGLAHILASGSLISESELLDEERLLPRQHSLFGNVAEDRWRSARPHRHSAKPK